MKEILPLKSRHRDYDPGVAVNIAGGFEKILFALDLVWQSSSLDDASYEILVAKNLFRDIAKPLRVIWT